MARGRRAGIAPTRTIIRIEKRTKIDHRNTTTRRGEASVGLWFDDYLFELNVAPAAVPEVATALRSMARRLENKIDR